MVTKTNPIVRLANTIAYNGIEALGKYYSKYRAFVFSNEDPNKLGRLQLIIPQISGNDFYNYWSFPCNVFSGPGYGSQVIPQQGDLVWVEFEGGCPEIPIWSHGYFGKDEKPKDEEMGDVNCYWFKTPKGHLVKLNDTKNTIHIESNQGDVVELNTNGVSIITKKDISLGTLNKSQYHAVLGEENKKVLNQIQTYLQDFSTALSADILSSVGSPYLKKTNLTAKAFLLLKSSITLKLKIEKILSDRITLDK